MITLSVVTPLWLDRPGSENVGLAETADELGYEALWIGEMATYDAFVLATSIGGSTSLAITVGPLAVGVRTAAGMAIGVASVSDLIGRPVKLALGASSPTVVDDWHGRSWRDTTLTLGESLAIARTLLDGGRTDHPGSRSRSRGFRLRLDPPGSHITVAAFGQKSLTLAAGLADRVVLNMVTVETAARIVTYVTEVAFAQGRNRPPPVAVWLPAAVDPAPAARSQMAGARVGYLGAPGYSEMFTEAGFGDLVAFALTRPHPRRLADAMPPELDDVAGLVGSRAQVKERIASYAEAGISEVCLAPATADDERGRRTLESLAV